MMSPYTLNFRDRDLEQEWNQQWEAVLSQTWDPIGSAMSAVFAAGFVVKGFEEQPYGRLGQSTQAGLVVAVLVRCLPLILQLASAACARDAGWYVRHRRLIMRATRILRPLPFVFLWPLHSQPCWVLRASALEMCVMGIFSNPAFFMLRFCEHVVLAVVMLAVTITILCSTGGLCSALSMLAPPVLASADAAMATCPAVDISADVHSCSESAIGGGAAATAMAAAAWAASTAGSGWEGAAADPQLPGCYRCPDMFAILRGIARALLMLAGVLNPSAIAGMSIAHGALTVVPEEADAVAEVAAAVSPATGGAVDVGIGLRSGWDCPTSPQLFDTCMVCLCVVTLMASMPFTLALYLAELRSRAAFLRLKGYPQFPSVDSELIHVAYMVPAILLALLSVADWLAVAFPGVLQL